MPRERRRAWAWVMTGLPSILADPPPPRVPRDLSTVLWRRGRLSLVLEPRAWLIGLYVAHGALYGCILPCLAMRWERQPRAVRGNAERPSGWMPRDWG